MDGRHADHSMHSGFYNYILTNYLNFVNTVIKIC